MIKRKYISLMVVILLLLLFSVQIISAESLPLMGVVITIDPGHGGIG